MPTAIPKKHQRDVIRWMDCAAALARRECGELWDRQDGQDGQALSRTRTAPATAATAPAPDEYLYLGKLRHVISGEKDMCFRVTAAK
jgi:hypothetical protein